MPIFTLRVLLTADIGQAITRFAARRLELRDRRTTTPTTHDDHTRRTR